MNFLIVLAQFLLISLTSLQAAEMPPECPTLPEILGLDQSSSARDIHEAVQRFCIPEHPSNTNAICGCLSGMNQNTRSQVFQEQQAQLTRDLLIQGAAKRIQNAKERIAVLPRYFPMPESCRRMLRPLSHMPSCTPETLNQFIPEGSDRLAPDVMDALYNFEQIALRFDESEDAQLNLGGEAGREAVSIFLEALTHDIMKKASEHTGSAPFLTSLAPTLQDGGPIDQDFERIISRDYSQIGPEERTRLKDHLTELRRIFMNPKIDELFSQRLSTELSPHVQNIRGTDGPNEFLRAYHGSFMGFFEELTSDSPLRAEVNQGLQWLEGNCSRSLEAMDQVCAQAANPVPDLSFYEFFRLGHDARPVLSSWILRCDYLTHLQSQNPEFRHFSLEQINDGLMQVYGQGFRRDLYREQRQAANARLDSFLTNGTHDLGATPLSASALIEAIGQQRNITPEQQQALSTLERRLQSSSTTPNVELGDTGDYGTSNTYMRDRQIAESTTPNTPVLSEEEIQARERSGQLLNTYVPRDLRRDLLASMNIPSRNQFMKEIHAFNPANGLTTNLQKSSRPFTEEAITTSTTTNKPATTAASSGGPSGGGFFDSLHESTSRFSQRQVSAGLALPNTQTLAPAIERAQENPQEARRLQGQMGQIIQDYERRIAEREAQHESLKNRLTDQQNQRFRETIETMREEIEALRNQNQALAASLAAPTPAQSVETAEEGPSETTPPSPSRLPASLPSAAEPDVDIAETRRAAGPIAGGPTATSAPAPVSSGGGDELSPVRTQGPAAQQVQTLIPNLRLSQSGGIVLSDQEFSQLDSQTLREILQQRPQQRFEVTKLITLDNGEVIEVVDVYEAVLIDDQVNMRLVEQARPPEVLPSLLEESREKLTRHKTLLQTLDRELDQHLGL